MDNPKFFMAVMIASTGLLGGIWKQSALAAPAPQPVSSTGAPSASSNLQSMSSAYENEQRVIFEARQNLIAQGATEQQLQAWDRQNSALLAAQGQQAQAMATTGVLQPLPTNHQPNIPEGASPTLKDFLVTRAALANARAQIHNQVVQQAAALGTSVTSTQFNQMEQQAIQQFEQQNAASMARQTQEAQALAQASARAPLPVPAPVIIAPNTPAGMATFLITRNQLRRSMIQVENQYASADPAARAAALAAWYQQNASQIRQMQQQAQSLFPAETPTPN